MIEVQCPHCGGSVVIEQMNCAIFRHGVFIRDGKQIPPHSSKTECDSWFEKKEIYGCGRPFRIIDDTEKPGNKKAIICDYI